MKVWDVQAKKCLGVLAGHTGSVKSVSSHPTNSGNTSFYPHIYVYTQIRIVYNFEVIYQQLISFYLQIYRYYCLWFKRRILSSLGLKVQLNF